MRPGLLALAAAASIACSGVTAFAADSPDSERMAEARALMGAIHIVQQMEAGQRLMAEQLARQYSMGIPMYNQRVMEVTMDELVKGFREQSSAPGGLLDLITTTFATEFTAAELRQIREFHETPAGQHMLAAQPEILRQLMPQVIKTTREFSPKLCPRVKARLIAESVQGGAEMTCPGAQ